MIIVILLVSINCDICMYDIVDVLCYLEEYVHFQVHI